MAKKKAYAVLIGRKTGVFDSWEEAQRSVSGFPNATSKGFTTKKGAQDYYERNKDKVEPKQSKVSNDGQANEESAKEVRIDMTDNYSYSLPDGEWEVSHGNNYTEEELDVTFYSTDKKVVIRGSTYECGQGYPLSAEILLSGRGAYVQYGTFYDITIAFAEDETIDTDGRKMNRATYCWPDDKKLCYILNFQQQLTLYNGPQKLDH